MKERLEHEEHEGTPGTLKINMEHVKPEKKKELLEPEEHEGTPGTCRQRTNSWNMQTMKEPSEWTGLVRLCACISVVKKTIAHHSNRKEKIEKMQITI